MMDVAWLSQEARAIHSTFTSLFYGVVLTLLLVGVLIEYFRWPLGGVPSFAVIVGRAIVAALLLNSYTDVTNYIGQLTDSLAAQVGDFNNISLVQAKMGEKLSQLSASWVSVRETIVVGIAYICFLLLYFSVFVAEGIYLFSWTILYVFSPILIALYVLPSTSGATTALYRSLFEVSCWKVVWSVLATLLWSMALSDITKADLSVVSIICMTLTLASSLLLTPWVVHGFAGAGISGFTRTLGSVAVGATVITPGRVIRTSKAVALGGFKQGRKLARTKKSKTKDESEDEQ
jgi:hypothetical protein